MKATKMERVYSRKRRKKVQSSIGKWKHGVQISEEA